MYQEIRVTYTNTNEWKLPLNLAIGFHILVALSAVFLPSLFDMRPKFEEIYTVDLINMAEPPPAAAPPAAAKPAAPKPAVPKTQPPPPPPEPAVPEKAVPIAESVPVETPAPPEAISIKPLKRKIKKELPPEPKPEPQKPKVEPEKPDPKVKELEKLKRQKIAEAIRAEQQAQEEARIATEEAENLRKILDETQAQAARAASTSAASQKSASSAQSSSVSSALEKQYYAAIFSRLHAFWSLPEFKEWDPQLTAVVVITINQNGEILDSMFEQRSGDKVFDQCVTKTLQDAAPLPPIPAALKKQRIEIGLRFTPGNIQ